MVTLGLGIALGSSCGIVQSPDAEKSPVVEGEPSAGHPRPGWRWSTPSGAQAFRVRIDGGEWTELSVSTTTYVAPSDLTEGEREFAVQARDADGLWSASGTFTTRIEYHVQPGFWNGTARTLATTPHGHISAVSAHNAYSIEGIGPTDNLQRTLDVIHAAQASKADLIELDLKDEDGQIVIGHDDGDPSGPLLVDVLDDAALRAGDQILFLELKETMPTPEFARALLDALAARRESYARNGRPVVIRSFHSHAGSLAAVTAALAEDDYLFIRPYVRSSVMFERDQQPQVAELQALIAAAAAEGHDMIELDFQNRNLHTLLAYAHELGLGVNLWTIPASVGEVFVANLRQETDVITVDYPVAKARDVVQDNTSMFYLNVHSIRDPSVAQVEYLDADNAIRTVAVNTTARPRVLVGSAGESLYGGYLQFVRSEGQYAPLYDAPTNPGEGVLVSAVVRFRDLAVEEGQVRHILAKSDQGEWTLALRNPGAGMPTVLRFGVYVGDSYVFANYPASSLNTTNTYLITGAYDGDGSVWLWVDNRHDGVTNGSASGGLTSNDVPAVIGADPQPGGNARNFSDIDIQMVLAQRWGAH